ncbi:MAG: dihydrofolate reductase, partial [Flavisolibacter sp.]|nr:dihydrofolate reductase [Flavisolibacter sp.]
VITRSNEWTYDGVEVVHSVEEAIEKAKEVGVKEIFVIGGAEIFQTAFAQANRIYLTRIHHRFDGDVYFLEVSDKDWDLVQSRFCAADGKNKYDHTFQVWERK